MLIDAYGRAQTSLRVSLTERCNLRCTYCRPSAQEDSSSSCSPAKTLSVPQLLRCVRVGVSLGIEHVRLTGGEPTLSRELLPLIQGLRELDASGLRDLSMTTNGLSLERLAGPLKAAGLKRVNISIDSLDPARFEHVTRGGRLEKVMRGVEAALDVGLTPVKLNVVGMRSTTIAELERWVELIEAKPLHVRFMELMPIGVMSDRARFEREFLDLTQISQQLKSRYGLVEQVSAAVIGSGPARYLSSPGGRGSLGFITPLTDPYCDTCSRLRLSAQGALRPCLASEVSVSLEPALLSEDDQALREVFLEAVARKPSGQRWAYGQLTPSKMHAIGG